MPSGPGVIEDSLIKTIADQIPPAVSSFLLTSEVRAENILNHHYLTHTNTLQLVDYLVRGIFITGTSAGSSGMK
jgi:phosphoribosylanthranilate isomerase